MDNLYFNANVNNDATPNISQIQQAVERTMKRLSEDINKSISPMLNDYAKQISDNLGTVLEKSIVKPLNEIKPQIVIPVEALENMQKAINNLVKNLNTQQSENEIKVDFTDEQIETLEAVLVPIDDYAKPEKSDKNHKIISKEKLTSLVILLAIIISFFSETISLVTAIVENNTAIINNDTAHTEYQTALVNNDTAKTQSKSQEDQINTLVELNKNLIDKLNEATADEVTST